MLWFLSAQPTRADECTIVNDIPAGDYAETVEYYRSGEFTQAGNRLRAVSQEQLDRIFVFLRTNDWPAPCFSAAALLHTEVGMAAILREDPERHFDAAWKLTNLVRDESVKRSVQRNWLLLMGLFYQKLMFNPGVFGQRRTETLSLDSELFRGAQTYFDQAVKAFPRDPEILVAAGTLFEWSGTPRFGERGHLSKAEDLYARATRADANDAVAQLRYGNTLWKRDRSEQATTPLQRVLELSGGIDLICRAYIALGRIEMLENNYDNAVEHFRAAVALQPDWQVGAVALSHALHMAGARDESRQVLERGLDSSSDERRFAWWSYETGLIERFDPLLEKMRDEVLQ